MLVVSGLSQPHGLQDARPPWPSPTLHEYFFLAGVCAEGKHRGRLQVGCILETVPLWEAVGCHGPPPRAALLSRRKEWISQCLESYYKPIIDLCTL